MNFSKTQPRTFSLLFSSNYLFFLPHLHPVFHSHTHTHLCFSFSGNVSLISIGRRVVLSVLYVLFEGNTIRVYERKCLVYVLIIIFGIPGEGHLNFRITFLNIKTTEGYNEVMRLIEIHIHQ